MSPVPPTNVGVAPISLSDPHWCANGGSKIKEAVQGQAAAFVLSLINDGGTSANSRLYPPLTTHLPFGVLQSLDEFVEKIYNPQLADYKEPTFRAWEAALIANGIVNKKDLFGLLLVDAIGERAVPYHQNMRDSVKNLMAAAANNDKDFKSSQAAWKRKDTAEEIEHKTVNFYATRTTKIPDKFFEPPAASAVAPAPAQAAPLAAPAPDLAAQLVAQAARPAEGVIEAVAVLISGAVAPAPHVDPDPEPEAGGSARGLQPRRAAQRPTVASKLRLRVRALEDQLRTERTKARRLRSAVKSGETTKKRLDEVVGAKQRALARAREAAAAAKDAQHDSSALRRELGRTQREAEAEQAAREKALAHTKAQVANVEGFLAERQTELLALRARATEAEAAAARAERARTVAERQLASAAASAQSSSAKADRLAASLAAMQQTLTRRDEQLDAAKQEARELRLLNKPTSRAEAATRDQLESELREAKALIGSLKSELKKRTTDANLIRKQSAASVAQAKATRGELDQLRRDGAVRSAGEDIDLLHAHYAALLAAKDAEIAALTTERDALRRIASPTAADVKPGGRYCDHIVAVFMALVNELRCSRNKAAAIFLVVVTGCGIKWPEDAGKPVLPARSTLASHQLVAAVAAQIQCVEVFFEHACEAQAAGRHPVTGANNACSADGCTTNGKQFDSIIMNSDKGPLAMAIAPASALGAMDVNKCDDFFRDVADDEIVTCEKRWVRAVVEGEPPAPLVSHSASLWRDRFLVVIGGGRHIARSAEPALGEGDEQAAPPPRGEWVMSGDVHVLDLEEMRWEQLHPGGDRFTPRRGHCALVLPSDPDVVIVFAGTDGEAEPGFERTRADVCELDMRRRAWRVRVAPVDASAAPAPRRGASSWPSLDGNAMVIVGGFCNPAHSPSSVYDTQLHAYHPAERRWTALQATGEPPLIALAACAVLPDRSVVVIVGGAAVFQPGGLAFFDQRLCCWSQPACESPRAAVTRRYSAAAALVGSTLVLFGGTAHVADAQDVDTHGDLHALALGAELRALAAAGASTAAGRRVPAAPRGASTGQWLRLAPEPAQSAACGSPAARNGMTLSAIRAGSTHVLIGGGSFREGGGEYLNDVWLLHARLRVALPGPDLGSDRALGGSLSGLALGARESRGADVLFELDCGTRVPGCVATLSAHSAYFKALLAGGFGETVRFANDASAGCPSADEPPRAVRVRGFSASTFCAALHYLHEGALPATRDCLANGCALLTELLLAADMWQCDEMRAALEARIAQLLLNGDLGTADVAALAETSCCERVALFAAELRAQEILFAPPAPAERAGEAAEQAAESGPFADLVERRLRRKGIGHPGRVGGANGLMPV